MKLHTLHLYKKIAELRHRQEFSQRELAERLHVPQSYLSKVESGKLDMGLANFVDVVRYLGAEVMIVPASMVPIISAMVSPDGEGNQNRPRWADSINEDFGEDE
jgi:transcriptional regulator with XRE-family HTH domain